MGMETNIKLLFLFLQYCYTRDNIVQINKGELVGMYKEGSRGSQIVFNFLQKWPAANTAVCSGLYYYLFYDSNIN